MGVPHAVRAAAWAALLSGAPSTLHALATGRDPLEAALAAGSILLPARDAADAVGRGGGPRPSRALARLGGRARPRRGAGRGTRGACRPRDRRASTSASRRTRFRASAHCRSLPQLADHAAYGAIAGHCSSLEPDWGEDDPDRAALRSRQRHVAGQQHLVVARDDPQVDVRRPALVRHRARALEAEAAGTVGDDRRAAGARVLAPPVRLPEMNLGSGDRAAVDGEDDAREDMALCRSRPGVGRASAERACPIGQRGRTPRRGAERMLRCPRRRARAPRERSRLRRAVSRPGLADAARGGQRD